jgi:WXXGXW repeat (2 copies)
MLNRSLLTLLAATALSTSAFVAPAAFSPAAAQVGVYIGAPPPVRAEVVPVAPAGQTWRPGYWNYEQTQHVWAPGTYIATQPDSHYVPDRWVQYQDNGRENWKREDGRWERN